MKPFKEKHTGLGVVVIGFLLLVGTPAYGEEFSDSFSQCWKIDLEKLNHTDIVVELSVALHEDGNIEGVQITDQDRFSVDEEFRGIAERVRGAVINCAPYKLPIHLYSDWQTLNLTFDLSRISGQ